MPRGSTATVKPRAKRYAHADNLTNHSVLQANLKTHGINRVTKDARAHLRDYAGRKGADQTRRLLCGCAAVLAASGRKTLNMRVIDAAKTTMEC